MARPSEKLCSPMPMAMSTASLPPGDRWWPERPEGGASSSMAAAPGPKGRAGPSPGGGGASRGEGASRGGGAAAGPDPTAAASTATFRPLQRSKYTRLSSPNARASVKVETSPVNLHQVP